jgi:hypothetical protein
MKPENAYAVPLPVHHVQGIVVRIGGHLTRDQTKELAEKVVRIDGRPNSFCSIV